MRDRGIPHDQLVWVDQENGGGTWIIHTTTILFGSVQVQIPAKSGAASLTDVQQRSVQMLRELPKSAEQFLVESLKRYASEFLDTDINTDVAFTFLCDNASVPYLQESSVPYIFLNASSDVDEDHGVCFLIRDGKVITCCHGDESLQFLGWDATDELDALADPTG